MPVNKNALLRYRILDRCFSDREKDNAPNKKKITADAKPKADVEALINKER